MIGLLIHGSVIHFMTEQSTKPAEFNLQDRFIAFAIAIIDVVSCLDSSRISQHLGGQLLRSGTSPALHYAEAMGAESRKDFIHKLRINLKELRESSVNLKILAKANKVSPAHPVHQECSELIAIISKSIQTATKNLHLK